MAGRNLDLSQSIFALTSGALPSAIAIIKVAGPSAFSIATKIFRPIEGAFDRSRSMRYGTLVDKSEKKIDEILLLSFIAPHSFSGEDTIEYHCHGSPAVIQRLQRLLVEFGARPAERGEFSYRALLNGKLSSTAIEDLGDLFLAREANDLNRIYSRRDRALELQIEALRNHLIRLQAILDTAVDFSEEYSSVVHLAKEPLSLVIQGCSEMIQRYGNFASGATIPKIVLAGRPNAGKSSLFNALLCRYRAIVHDEPGTTRDVIEEEIEVEGRRWKLVDTAGFREGITSAEREGIAMGQDFLSDSSVWVLVVDGRETLSFEDIYLLEKYGSKKPFVILWNKSDLPGFRPPESISGKTVVCGSARQGDKLEEFWERLRHTLARVRVDDFGPLPTSTQAARLRFVVEELQGLVADLAAEVPPEYLAEKNRSVIARLESVVGEIGTEDVLDRVFGEFCIGK